MNRFSLITFALLIILSNEAPGAQRLLLVTGEFPPWTTETQELQGVFTEVVREAFAAENIEFDLKFLPWKRAQWFIQKGDAFAAFPYAKTPERHLEYRFSEPVMISVGRFFYNPAYISDPPDFKQLNDLKSYRIVGVYGYWYRKKFKEAGLNVDYVNTEIQQLLLISSGRFDLAPLDQVMANVLIKQHFPNNETLFEALPMSLNTSSLHLMVSQKYPESPKLLQQFNQGLATIRNNGIYRQILRRNGVELSPEYKALLGE